MNTLGGLLRIIAWKNKRINSPLLIHTLDNKSEFMRFLTGFPTRLVFQIIKRLHGLVIGEIYGSFAAIAKVVGGDNHDTSRSREG